MFLEFRWELGQSDFPVWYYEFRIFRGSEMTPAAEIFAKKTSELTTSVIVPTDYFKNGETYIWSVVQISSGPVFSEKALHSFEVRKGD